ncbi:MAG: hypothetical protein L0H75_00210 [Nitrosospira sp.]|nr:hypothetical protein [Nitrosospira sp.]
MFDTLWATIISPSGLIVMIIGGVISQILTGWISLVFGKTKNALLGFLTERSDKQKTIRRRLVEIMRADKNKVHYFVMRGNLYGNLSIILLLVAATNTLLAFAARSDNDAIIINFLIINTGICMVTSIYCLFRSLAITQDVGRVVWPTEQASSDNPTPDEDIPFPTKVKSPVKVRGSCASG